MTGRLVLLLFAAAATSPALRPHGPLTGAWLAAAAGDVAARSVVLVGGWVALVMLATGVARLPGRLAPAARAALALLLPRAARAALLGLVGAQALAGTAVAADATLDPADALAVQRPATSAAWSIAPPPAPPAAVVVGHGDTLWAIAARALPPEADVGAIAAAWPAWYAANRQVVGPDPNLLQVGLVLQPPATAQEA